jgi:hypothetical protein
MLTAFALTLALGAPIPPEAPPVAAGIAPRVMELKPDSNGKITVAVTRTEMQKVAVAVGGAAGGGAAPQPAVREVQVTKSMVVELNEVKDLTITSADGKKLDKEEALKNLKAGAIVVVSSDGKPVSPVYLKVFKDDTLVLTSPELAANNGLPRPSRGPIQAPGIQIQPGVIQIQIAPGAAPAVPVQPVPPPAAKPAQGGN